MHRLKQLLPALVLTPSLLAATPAPTSRPDPLKIYDDVVKLVEDNYYDQTYGGLAFDKAADEQRRGLTPTSDDAALNGAISSLLSRMGRSHTKFLSTDDQEYWALKSIFSGDLNGMPVKHIGIWFERRGARWFARNVFPGGPAAAAGIVRGDEMLSVDGQPFSPVAAFAKAKAGQTVQLAYKHLPWQPSVTVGLKVVDGSLQKALHEAMLASWMVHEQGGKKIAYIWLPTGTHEEFKKTLVTFAREASKQADALVLDLRDGFGGADPTFLEPFFQTDPKAPAPIYTKPLVTLVNEGTRSGKEWLAWLIQGQKRGPLVGTRTAGAFLAAKLFDVVPGRYALYLPVGGTRNIGVELEGVGVSPDVTVAWPLSYAAGGDPQLSEAFNVAAKIGTTH